MLEPLVLIRIRVVVFKDSFIIPHIYMHNNRIGKKVKSTYAIKFYVNLLTFLIKINMKGQTISHKLILRLFAKKYSFS